MPLDILPRLLVEADMGQVKDFVPWAGLPPVGGLEECAGDESANPPLAPPLLGARVVDEWGRRLMFITSASDASTAFWSPTVTALSLSEDRSLHFTAVWPIFLQR